MGFFSKCACAAICSIDDDLTMILRKLSTTCMINNSNNKKKSVNLLQRISTTMILRKLASWLVLNC